MKVMKKLAAVLLTICLMVPMSGVLVFAADGRLSFSDPQTKVGENVNVDLAVRSGEGNIGDVSVTLSYDTESLEFVSGDGFEADGSGNLTYSGTGDGDGELRATMVFRALKTGSTTISVVDSTASMESGDTLNLQEGSSAVTIDAADDGSTTAEPTGTGTTAAGETTDITVDVNGTTYNFSEAFTTSDIPSGYAETTQTFEGAEHRFVANDAGIYLGYLVDSSGSGSFFLYDTETSSFSPYVELGISNTTSLILLNEPEAVSLPDGYQEVNLTVLDQQYPSWSNAEQGGRFCVLYALNTRTGEKGLYQYDTEDGTYQSFSVSNENESSGITLPGALGSLIGDNAVILLAAMAVVMLVLLVLMIIFAVKLVHRNQELDDLYDEYDIPFDDDEEEEEEQPAAKPKKRFFGRKKDEEDEEDEEDYDDDDDYDDYDDEDEYDDYDDDDYDDDEDEYDDDDEEVSRQGKTKNIRKTKKASRDDDDDYDIDFIDL